MKFDQLSTEPCLRLPISESPPPVDPPEPPDPPFEQILELRPDLAVLPKHCSVQYATFLISNGIEQEITSGLTYRSSNVTMAAIGVTGGNATAVEEGIVTISVEWQGMEAFSQLEVVGSCAAYHSGIMVVMDRSESMSQVQGSGFGTKLEFGKFLATRFLSRVNSDKDKVGLVAFGVSAELLSPLTDDKSAVVAALHDVSYLTEETDISSGLDLAISELESVSLDRRIILLVTDGQVTDGDEPVAIAQQFRSGGGVIIGVTLRSGTVAFQRVEKIANGGFLVSAYDEATSEDAKRYLMRLTGYLCAATCCSAGPSTLGTPQLQYTEWYNWIGMADLIGPGLFDYLPGNGNYVDLVASGPPWTTPLISKTTFTFIAGHQYALKYKLAGNQIWNVPGYRVRVTAGSLSNVVVTVDDWKQPFTDYADYFVGNGTSGRLTFFQETQPADDSTQSRGTLLDQVSLVDVTTGQILFADNFDNENFLGDDETFTTDDCPPVSYEYNYNYDCCPPFPVKAQLPDPSPPTEIEVEGEGDPFWISTQFYTASCAAGTTGPDVTKSATYKSFVSAADAVAKALALARVAAENALVCTPDPFVGELLNINWSSEPLSKTGKAAIGNTSDDFWNTWNPRWIPGPVQLMRSDNTPSAVTIFRCFVTGFAFADHVTPFVVLIAHTDPMYRENLFFLNEGGNTAVPEAAFFDGLVPGVYEVYVYGHGDFTTQVGSYYAWAGKLVDIGDGNYQLDAGTMVPYGKKETSTIDPPAAGNFLETFWHEGSQYVKYTITVPAGLTGICVLCRPSPETQIGFGGLISVQAGVQILRIS